MAVAYQGFAIEENLSEAINDRAILNNIGGSPIGDDISLLFNNTRNFSQLVVTESNVQGSVLVFPGAAAVFSNKTKITVGTSTYYVKDSNGINQFSLSAVPDLSTTVVNPPTGTYIRSDTVTFTNITNFSRIRRNPDVNRVDNDTQLGFLRNSSTASLLSSETVKAQLEAIERNVDFYNFKSSQSIKVNRNFLGSKVAESNGTIIIRDPDGQNNSGLNNSKPGLFIYNPNTGTGVRAFSSSDNPWRASGSDLLASTSSVNIKRLNFIFETIVLTSKNGVILTETVVADTVLSNFTHKVPVTINNELYYLCLKLES